MSFRSPVILLYLWCALHTFVEQRRRVYLRAFLHNHSSFQDVFQFTNISRPRIARKLYYLFLWKTYMTSRRDLREKVGTDVRDIALSFPERRHMDINHA